MGYKARHMKLTKGRFAIGLGIFVYVAIIVLTPVLYAKVIAVREQQKLANAEQALNVAIQQYAYDGKSTVKLDESLTNFALDIKKLTIKTNAPGQAEFEAKSVKIQKAILSLASTATYAKQFGGLLAGQQLGGKFVSADDAANLAKKWQVFNDVLKKLNPPSELQKQHQVLVASTANQVAIANKASDAYKANDSATIAAQTKAAADELAKIQAVYDDIYSYVRAQQGLIVSSAQLDKSQVCKPISTSASAC